MRYGYARVSTNDWNLDRQRVALGLVACDEMIEETRSGVTVKHHLDALLARLHEGDELVVTELDHLGRSTSEIIMIMDDLASRGIGLRFLSMPSFDIRDDKSRLIADVIAAFAAHERRRTKRRQEQGIAAARAAGRHLGRRPKLSSQQIAEAQARLRTDEPVSTVAKAYGVCAKTLRDTIKRVGIHNQRDSHVELGL